MFEVDPIGDGALADVDDHNPVAARAGQVNGQLPIVKSDMTDSPATGQAQGEACWRGGRVRDTMER